MFGQTPDSHLSSITVVNSSGASVDSGPTAVVPGNPLALEVPLKAHLANGVYTVTWKTVSTVDGHLATGSFAFGVGVSAASLPRTPAVVGASPPSPLTVVARLLLFVGLVLVVGAVVLGIYAFGAPPASLRAVIVAGAVVVFAGTVGVVVAQAMTAGVGVLALLGTSLRTMVISRSVAAVLLLGCALLLVRGTRVLVLSLATGVLALGTMAVDVLSSHAGEESPAALNAFAQALHIAAVAVWIGGLVALLVSIRRSSGDDATRVTRRLSRLAGIGIVVVAATGVFRAVIEVQTWSNLVSTAFGALVLLKIGLLLLLAGLGAINRYINVPRLPRAFPRLRRLVSTEALIALGALTVAAALVNVAPPVDYAAAAAAAQPANVVVSGSDYATTVKVRLTVTSGSAGFNTFDLGVSDYNTGAAVNASSVVLQFTQPFRPNLGISTLTLARHGSGDYEARGGNMSLPGIWEIAAIIENGLGSTEVHLQVETNERPPVVQVSRFTGGLPTLYTIHATPTVYAQVYLDPEKPGADQFHCTWLDPNGNEIPISDMTMGMTTPGGTPTILVHRRLDDIGHFVADATVPAGTTRFDVLATAVDGRAFSTFINLTPGK